MPSTTNQPPFPQRALLLGAETASTRHPEAEALLEELEELVSNLGIETVERKILKVRHAKAALYFGKGQTQAILEQARSLDVDAIIFDEPLSPAQQRNWEYEAGAGLSIIDRQKIILDIFSQRAATKEASLQVELARLQYELPRMKRAWTHLNRQRSGGAVQRDAGETQLEIDQRLIRTRIARLKAELIEVVRQRDTQRKQRMKVSLPSAAIVGYTNAGKSSLLNLLSDAEVIVENKLFATLDPTTRRTVLSSGQILLLTDTVGFIRRLPHRLIEAFKATLEEAVVVNFLIHLIDASSPDAEAHATTTIEVLAALEADQKDQITVFNKIDQVDDPLRLALLRAKYPNSLFISVHSGQGIEALQEALAQKLEAYTHPMVLLIPHQRYDLTNRLHEAGAILSKKTNHEGILIKGNIPKALVDTVKAFQTKDRKNEDFQ